MAGFLYDKDMSTYGINYQGSKNRIARQVVDAISIVSPRGGVVVDLFAGGHSITHGLESYGYQIVANEINTYISSLMSELYHGNDFYNRIAFIFKEEFDRIIGDPSSVYPYIAGLVMSCYSFGGDLKSYFCSVDKMEDKALEFDRIMFGIDHDRDDIRGRILVQAIGCLKRLDRFATSNRYRRKASGFTNIDFISKDYREVRIEDGDTVYCDPPYRGTKDYGTGFNHGEFDDFVRELSKTNPVIVSEYSMPDDFVCVKRFDVRVLQNATNSGVVSECLFVHESRKDDIQSIVSNRNYQLFDDCDMVVL